MIFDVVHIGQGKCLSTTLQGLWHASPLYHCVNAAAISPKVNERLLAARREAREPAPMRLELPANPGRPVSLLTTEAFSYSPFSDKPHLFDLVAERQRYMAQQFGGCGRRVLMVVRHPLDWVRSVHAQHVKEGGTRGCADYVAYHRPVLLQHLDLVHLLSVWRAVNPEVVVLPMELYAHDPGAFWALYTQTLQVPAPEPLHVPRYQNRSRYERLALSAQLNGLLGELAGLLEPLGASHAKSAAEGLREAKAWGVRRAMEHATEAQLQALCRRLGHRPDPAFLEWVPDDALLAHVRECFVPALREWPHMAPWLAAYAEPGSAMAS